MKEAFSNAKRLAVADQARTNGDIDTASRLYLRIASKRLPDTTTQLAKRRLQELGGEARQKLADVQQVLARWDTISPSEPMTDHSARELITAMTQIEQLSKDYGRVPAAGKEVKTALSKQRRKPVVQAVVREPDAERLWKEGQALEHDGHVCCAMLMYEKTRHLLPAKSAQLAQQRLSGLQQDPQNVEAAEKCRELQWCHQRYRVATMVAKADPVRAQELYAQIARRAPNDSDIYKEVMKEMGR